MGFLKNLLTPHKHFDGMKNSTKALLRGDVKAGLDMYGQLAGKYKNNNVASAEAEPTYAIDPTDASMYEGDMGDPAYGSFTDPFTVEDFYDYADPGYAFRLQQGNQALMNAASAGSGAFSGAALKDLLQYNQDYASSEYGNAFNRYQTQQGNIFSRLFDVARLGQNAAAGVGTEGTNLAGNAGQFYSNAGAAQGAGYVGAGNALSQGATNYWLMKQFGQPTVSAPGGV